MLRLPNIPNRRTFLRGVIRTTLLPLLFCCLPTWAANIEQLRASGAVGESLTGYVVARDPSAKAAVDAINAQRRAIYQQKAAEQGVSIDQVGKVYAIELFKKIPAGTWIQKENGQWVQK